MEEMVAMAATEAMAAMVALVVAPVLVCQTRWGMKVGLIECRIRPRQPCRAPSERIPHLPKMPPTNLHLPVIRTAIRTVAYGQDSVIELCSASGSKDA